MLLLAFSLVFVALLRQAKYSCPLLCPCTETQIHCHGIVPDPVPETTKEVVVSDLHPKEYYTGRFCNLTWQNVAILSIKTSMLYPFNLRDGVFNCLEQLRTFKLHAEALFHVSSRSFTGLTNILTMDLSGCRRLYWSDLYKVFSLHSNFPNLTHLNLSRPHYLPFHFNRDWETVLGLRPITFIEISQTIVSLSLSSNNTLCDTLSTLVMQDSFISQSGTVRCSSVRTLDLSGNPFTTDFLKRYTCVNKSIHFVLDLLENTARVLYWNRIATVTEGLTMNNCSFFMFMNTSIRELHFAHNHLPNFDVNLINPHLEYIDLSYNKIENISSNAFLYLTSLLRLNLSNNNLYKAHSFEDRFLVLYKNVGHLKILDLSYNKLSYLPHDTFISNGNLEQLNMAGNRLQQIDFSIAHLSNLKILDLQSNAIKYLNKYSRHSLDQLYHIQQTMNTTNRTFQVLLENNPFSCECSSLGFLRWFVASPIFSITSEYYQCHLQGQVIPITALAVDASQEDCERTKHQRRMNVLLSILPPTGGSAIVIVLILLYKRRQRRLLEQRYADRVRLLRENDIGFQFPVLLSYASSDFDFVAYNILRPLRVSIIEHDR